MLTRLQVSSELESTAKKFARKNLDIADIIVYGSIVRGKEDARDIDVAIVLAAKTKEDRKLSLAQELKESIEKNFPSMQIDVKATDFADLCDASFLARQGIIAEGYSLLKKQYVAQYFGFRTFVLIKYSLKDLTYSQKKMLYYALKGRRGNKGMLDSWGGELISREVLRVPIDASHKIENLLAMHHVKFTIEYAMVYKKR